MARAKYNPIFNGPVRIRRTRDGDKRIKTYESKFVRVGTRVVVTKPNDTKTTYKDLVATVNGLSEEIEIFKKNSPDEVDAGMLRVKNLWSEILVFSFSREYEVPILGSKARRRTGEVLSEQSKGCQVITDADPQRLTRPRERK